MKRKMTKWITWYMVTVMFFIGITPRLYAGFSPSEGIALYPMDRHSDLDKIQKFLKSKMSCASWATLSGKDEFAPTRLDSFVSRPSCGQLSS